MPVTLPEHRVLLWGAFPSAVSPGAAAFPALPLHPATTDPAVQQQGAEPQGGDENFLGLKVHVSVCASVWTQSFFLLPNANINSSCASDAVHCSDLQTDCAVEG